MSSRTKPLMLVSIALAAVSIAPGASGLGSGSRASVLQARADLLEVFGVREFSGRLIARPLQSAALLADGSSPAMVAVRREEARRDISRHEILRRVRETDEYIIAVPVGATERDVIGALMATGNFQYVEPDWLVSPLGDTLQAPRTGQTPANPKKPKKTGKDLRPPNCPDDPLFGQQWHHQPDLIQSCAAWTTHTGTPSVTIGLCDTGILTTHEDLQLHRLEAYNAVDMLWESEGGQIGPRNAHGTKTTGTAAANGNNGLGVVGVGWNLSHRMIRVSNLSSGNAFLSDIQHGARTSAESGDKVVNVSYAGVTSVSNLTTATYIRSLGALLLWGSGNSGGYLSGDRDADDLIVVGATDQFDARWSSSNYGPFVDLFAPGVDIITTDAGFDTDYTTGVSGTSYASPMAAGLCAMIWSARPHLTPKDVELILKGGAEDLGSPGVDSVFGYGRINVRESLRMSGVTTPAADMSTATTSGLSPLSVEFLDQSTGVPAFWLWNFGDGSASRLQNPTHTYTSSGSYTVSLSVVNAMGSDAVTRTDYVLVDVIPPVAGFTGTPTAGLSPLTVDFTDESSGGVPTTWLWDFGDGTTGSVVPNPSHTYTVSGAHTVSLTVSNAYGSDTLTRSSYVAVDVIPPVAEFSGQPTSGASPLVVDFSDESTEGVATSWQWNFGDGSSSSLQDPTHIYTVAGTYSVSLVVSNAYGMDTRSRPSYVQVLPGPAIVADLAASTVSGAAPLQVDFTDLSIGYPVTWTWQFGDGGSSTLQNPTHVYSAPGLYTVILEVFNAIGDDDCLELEDYILVQ